MYWPKSPRVIKLVNSVKRFRDVEGGVICVGGSDGIKHRFGPTSETTSVPASLEISLLQLNFSVLLRESTRTAEPRKDAVTTRVATNTIALADFFARANLQDPLVAREHQSTINAAVRVVLFATGGKHGALVLQAAEVLSVPAINDARTASGEAAKAAFGEAIE